MESDSELEVVAFFSFGIAAYIINRVLIHCLLGFRVQAHARGICPLQDCDPLEQIGTPHACIFLGKKQDIVGFCEDRILLTASGKPMFSPPPPSRSNALSQPSSAGS